MYEPIRTKPVHRKMADADKDRRYPHRSREEELDIQLAGHLAALLAVTDELRALAPEPDADLDRAAERLAAHVARLRQGRPSIRSAMASAGHEPYASALHRKAHALAGRALVVAASRADTAAAILAAERMDVHAAAFPPAKTA